MITLKVISFDNQRRLPENITFKSTSNFVIIEGLSQKTRFSVNINKLYHFFYFLSIYYVNLCILYQSMQTLFDCTVHNKIKCVSVYPYHYLNIQMLLGT